MQWSEQTEHDTWHCLTLWKISLPHNNKKIFTSTLCSLKILFSFVTVLFDHLKRGQTLPTDSGDRYGELKWKWMEVKQGGCEKTRLWHWGVKEKPCGIDCPAAIVCLAAPPSPSLRGDLSTKRPLITEWEDGGVLFRGRTWPLIHLYRDPDTTHRPRGAGSRPRWRTNPQVDIKLVAKQIKDQSSATRNCNPKAEACVCQTF